jgi:predicted Zn-dependent protease
MSESAFRWTDRSAYWVSERAYLLFTEGRYRESLALLEGLMELFPQSVYYKDSASALHLALGNPREAIRYATDVITVEPDNISALVRRCEGYLLLGVIAEAVHDLERMKVLRAHAPMRRMEMRLSHVRGGMASSSVDMKGVFDQTTIDH